MIDYEKENQSSRNVCGEPFPEFLSFLRIMMMNVLPLFAWVTDKDEMPCSLPAKDIRF